MNKRQFFSRVFYFVVGFLSTWVPLRLRDFTVYKGYKIESTTAQPNSVLYWRAMPLGATRQSLSDKRQRNPILYAVAADPLAMHLLYAMIDSVREEKRSLTTDEWNSVFTRRISKF